MKFIHIHIEMNICVNCTPVLLVKHISMNYKFVFTRFGNIKQMLCIVYYQSGAQLSFVFADYA